jgi:predicted nucleotide-binding protein (sugar kinase/HSP70/actin superfamily)
MTLVVGGLSSTHDRLLAAALRGRGVAAEALATPDARALATGRALLGRAHCNPTYYLAGALVEHVRAHGAEGRAHLTLSSCGPCRFANYANEYRRALGRAGFPDVPVATLSQERPQATAALTALGLAVDARLLRALARAVVAADVLTRAGCEARARADRRAVTALLHAAEVDLAALLEARRPLGPRLAELGAGLAALPPRPDPARLTVHVTGELFAATTDGEGGHHLVRWLEERGARVWPPALAEWLLYLCWQARARRSSLALHRLYRMYAGSAGVTTPLADMDDLAALADPYYSTALRGGMGHLEVASYLAASRAGADLVVSIKPFGCLPSSAISDGVVPSLARTRRTVFVSIETSGDAHTQVESRLSLALDQACSLKQRSIG